ncbi:TlpA family protein disulfide reductase [Chitinophaga horti]|uniref:TlpA family protein disulfide reductase n=1 Tax=Chitinophaga horti TaxID=2920382 RepID=A0ABY6J8E0_9BACT|nr:TlpA disulfide reductase family protein [Chitinophaga horti]UYQ95946.1 TlpA family protein disulfide reductase [Chitinophaga horti]
MKEKDIDVRQTYWNQVNQLKKRNEHLTAAGHAWTTRYDSLKQAIANWKYDLMAKDLNLANFYRLYDDVLLRAANNRQLLEPIRKTYAKYLERYPQHPYSQKIQDGLSGLLQVFPGNPYITFHATDLAGKDQPIAPYINGKFSLIDLWGSWCGPCIAKSRMVVPLFEKYKDKGFAVVGVAREFDNTKALERCLKREQFPWPQLVEVNDRHGIWNKYGVQNNAGLFILIDAQGKILAIDPTPEELAQYLRVLDQPNTSSIAMPSASATPLP